MDPTTALLAGLALAALLLGGVLGAVVASYRAGLTLGAARRELVVLERDALREQLAAEQLARARAEAAATAQAEDLAAAGDAVGLDPAAAVRVLLPPFSADSNPAEGDPAPRPSDVLGGLADDAGAGLAPPPRLGGDGGGADA